MYDKDHAIDILSQIYQATLTIIKRFSAVKSVSDFTDSEYGVEKLDSICMLLIAIGESLKNLDKVTNKSLLVDYPQIDWKKAKGMRDIICHHYFDVDAEVIYDVCDTKIDDLSEMIKKINEDLQKNR